MLYVPQITSLLALFEGEVNVVTRLSTSAGKTAGYEPLTDLYRFLFPGFCPVMWIIGPLTNLMQEQVSVYNALMVECKSPSRAAHVSREQKDQHVLGKVLSGADSISIVHISVEKAVGKKRTKRSQKYRGLLQTYRNRLVAIACEEAHTVNEWKHEFRPLYQRLPELRSLVPAVPWTLVSATLTQADVHSLCTQLDLSPNIWIQGLFTRPNIFLDRVKINLGPDDLQTAIQPMVNFLAAGREKTGHMNTLMPAVE